MVRVIIKGGVWKNTEDEILKAAIMKYGKNQWSRIASLLHRKSAKQCKARWHEWLDPRIKKTEWSREEDEKLLHLAKIMPTQWRTIAPIVGRTSAQCLERYEHLLDEAQRRAEGLDEEDTIKSAKKLKPGDVDPTPETKPARPDPMDMDEDELEMLSEARARLANTQGKKAKRKAREKQLAEARRLASLQKRRELRAAGIGGGGNGAWRFRKRGLIDYNAEIPFEKPVPAGFYDPSEDTFDKTKQVKLDDRPRDVKENEARKKDREKLKRKNAEDKPESIFSEKQEKKRSKLILPEPQISDQELEQIVKIGHASDTVRELIDESATSTLLHDYSESARSMTAAARTMRTPAAAFDSVARIVTNRFQAADDLLALTNVETPLKGGLNTPLHSLDFAAPNSTRQPVTTPNTVLSAIAATPQTQLGADGQTPASQFSATPGSTPFRDQLNINRRLNDVSTKDRLRKMFHNLPKPKNNFDVVAPEEEEQEAEEDEDWIEDAEERQKRQAEAAERRRIAELKLRSQAVQRGLPLPVKLNEFYKKPAAVRGEFTAADDLIKSEIYALMEWDVRGKTPAVLYSPDELAEARQLIDAELEKMERPTLDANMWQVIANCAIELIQYQDRFTRLSNLSRKDQIEALTANFNTHYNWITQQAKRCSKLENKLKVKLGGYAQIEANVRAKSDELKRDVDRLLVEAKTFQRLEENEECAIVKRLETIKEEVRVQTDREKELQKRFDDANHRLWELKQMEARQQATTSSAPVVYEQP